MHGSIMFHTSNGVIVKATLQSGLTHGPNVIGTCVFLLDLYTVEPPIERGTLCNN